MRKENGYTLVEVLIVIFIGTMMLMAIYTAVNTGQISSGRIERRVAAQQDARNALELMAMEVRMASYNPYASNTIWVSANCSGSSSYKNYRGIQEAGANYITLEMDINDNGVIDSTNSNPNEIIKYFYDAGNLEITRSTNCGANVPFLGAPAASADTRTVLVQNNAANVPIFRYYDGFNTQLYPDTTNGIGANIIPNIRRIEITFVADTSSTDNSGGRRRIIYSNSVLLRNHSIPTF